jgi:hypothetical protein
VVLHFEETNKLLMVEIVYSKNLNGDLMKRHLEILCFGLVLVSLTLSALTLSKEQKEEILKTISHARGVSCDQPKEDVMRSESELAEEYYYLAALENTSADTAEIQSLRTVAKKEMQRLVHLHRYCKQ